MKRLVPLLAALTCSSACLSVPTYGTARTLEAGDWSHTIGANSLLTSNGEASIPIPGLSYGVRRGLDENLDFGLQANVPQLRGGVDVKWNFFRSPSADIAVSPRLAVGLFPADDGKVYVDAEFALMANLNASESVTLVPFVAPAALYVVTADSVVPAVRMGAGAEFRFDSWSIGPQVIATYDPASETFSQVGLGIGVGLGDQPVF